MPARSAASFTPREADRAGLAFVGASLVVGALTAWIGWSTDMRLAVDGALAAVALIAFFPVLVVIVTAAVPVGPTMPVSPTAPVTLR